MFMANHNVNGMVHLSSYFSELSDDLSVQFHTHNLIIADTHGNTSWPNCIQNQETVKYLNGSLNLYSKSIQHVLILK